MVRFSIKPSDQTDETESPNLIKETGLLQKGEYTKAFSNSVSIIKIFSLAVDELTKLGIV